MSPMSKLLTGTSLRVFGLVFVTGALLANRTEAAGIVIVARWLLKITLNV